MSDSLPIGVLTGYIEGVGFFYSDDNPGFFKLLPISQYEISYDENGPRYIIKLGQLTHSIINKYLQWNPESQKLRIILGIVDGEAHNRNLLHVMSMEFLNETIDKVKREKDYEHSMKLIQNGKFMDLYDLQQEKISINREITKILKN